MRKTKIVATIGPASSDPAVFAAMCKAGVNVARLNFSHGTHEEQLAKIHMIKKVREELDLPIAIMLDTKGPEYRTGTFKNGKVHINDGDLFTFTTRDIEGDEGILMVSHWPEYDEALNFPAEEASIDAVMDVIRAIRARRAEMNVPPSKKAEVLLVTATPEIYQQGLHFLQRLAYASEVRFADAAPADAAGQVSVVTHNATAYMPLSELVDLAAERERVAKELEKARNGLRITEGKLSNEKFVAHAPENVVNAEREKVTKYQELIAKLEASAKSLEG